MREFYRAKKQAEFMEWVEMKQYEAVKKNNDEVEYFD